MNKDKTFIIAEMACSHEGDPALARMIIDVAGQAGVDAMRSQTSLLASVGGTSRRVGGAGRAPRVAGHQPARVAEDDWRRKRCN